MTRSLTAIGVSYLMPALNLSSQSSDRVRTYSSSWQHVLAITWARPIAWLQHHNGQLKRQISDATWLWSSL